MMLEQESSLPLYDPTWSVKCRQCSRIFSVPDAIDQRIPRDGHFSELELRCPKCRYLFQYKRREMFRRFDLPSRYSSELLEHVKEEKRAYESRIWELEQKVMRLREQLKGRDEQILVH